MTTPLLTPPRYVGSDFVADILGVSRWTVRRQVNEGVHPYTVGYVGKLSGRHCWDANQFLDGSGLVPCAVCGVTPTTAIGLCTTHTLHFQRSWDRSERSRVSLLQFIAICRWVVERWEHLGPIDVGDVWSSTCLTPGCDGEANRGGLGPLCASCSVNFRARIFVA